MPEIPLFPLPIVMFPDVLAPLHIFEDRYKLLINRSIEESSVFGIVLIAPGSSRETESTISRIGVAVRVTQFERIEDGRLNIVVAGERRFKILEFTGNDPYWTAKVEFIEDDESDDELKESATTVTTLYREVHALAANLRSAAGEEPRIPESPAALSCLVSYVLDISLDAKQELLEMSSVTGRLKTLAIHLEGFRQRLNARTVLSRLRRRAMENRGDGGYGVPN